MADFNKVIIIGHLTRDPELRYTPGGLAVSTLSMAVNNRYRQNNEEKNEVCYIDVSTFGKQAENCSQYLNKGSSVIVEGRLKERRWESQDGQKRSKHEIVASSITFMSKKGESGDRSPLQNNMDEGTDAVNLNNDDVPF